MFLVGTAFLALGFFSFFGTGSLDFDIIYNIYYMYIFFVCYFLHNNKMNQSGYADLLNQSTSISDQSIIYNLILPNLDPNSVPYIDVNNTVQDRILTNGQLLIGVSAGAPVAASLTGTTDEIIVTPGSGTITLSTPQPIATTSNPTFNNLTVTTINGKTGNDLVTGPVSAVADRLASYNGTTGKVIKDSAINTADVFLRTGTVAATGNFNMNNKELQDVAAIRPHNTNINIGNTTTLSSVGTGQIVLGDFTTSTGSSNVCIGLSNIARNLGVAIGKETICGVGGVSVGYRSQTSQTDVIHIGRDNFSNALGADIFGVNQTNSQANTLLLGNGSYTNIRANGTVCDLGTSLVSFKDIYSNGSLNGTVNSRFTNDVVSNTSTGTLNNLASFVSDKVIKDSGVSASTGP